MREITENKEYPGFLLKCNEHLKLDSGKSISNFQIAYQTYGKLNDKKLNLMRTWKTTLREYLKNDYADYL